MKDLWAEIDEITTAASRNVTFEHVEWDHLKIEQGVGKLLDYYISNLTPLGTINWIKEYKKILDGLSQTRQLYYRLNGYGFMLTIYGPRGIVKTDSNTGAVEIYEREPRIRVTTRQDVRIRPSLRNLFNNFTEQVGTEMSETYKMDVTKKPITYTLPKAIYAKNVPNKAIATDLWWLVRERQELP